MNILVVVLSLSSSMLDLKTFLDEICGWAKTHYKLLPYLGEKHPWSSYFGVPSVSRFWLIGIFLMKYDAIPTFEDLKKARCVWTVVSNLNKRWSVFWGGGPNCRKPRPGCGEIILLKWAECEGSYPLVVKVGGLFMALGLLHYFWFLKCFAFALAPDAQIRSKRNGWNSRFVNRVFILIEHKLK